MSVAEVIAKMRAEAAAKASRDAGVASALYDYANMLEDAISEVEQHCMDSHPTVRWCNKCFPFRPE